MDSNCIVLFSFINLKSPTFLLQETNFINDTLRSEFHKKFMEKYVKWSKKFMEKYVKWSKLVIAVFCWNLMWAHVSLR